MSKHKDRRQRRERYHQMLDAELGSDGAERQFVNRVLSTMDHDGVDFAPDGRPIKADFWRYVASREGFNVHTALAGEHLIERSISMIQVDRI